MLKSKLKIHWAASYKFSNNILQGVVACGRHSLDCSSFYSVSKVVLLEQVTCKECLKRIEKELK